MAAFRVLNGSFHKGLEVSQKMTGSWKEGEESLEEASQVVGSDADHSRQKGQLVDLPLVLACVARVKEPVLKAPYKKLFCYKSFFLQAEGRVLLP